MEPKTKIYGLYQHYKGDLYVVKDVALESTNGLPRKPRVQYISLGQAELDSRFEDQFHEWVDPKTGEVAATAAGVPRFRLLQGKELEQISIGFRY